MDNQERFCGSIPIKTSNGVHKRKVPQTIVIVGLGY